MMLTGTAETTFEKTHMAPPGRLFPACGLSDCLLAAWLWLPGTRNPWDSSTKTEATCPYMPISGVTHCHCSCVVFFICLFVLR